MASPVGGLAPRQAALSSVARPSPSPSPSSPLPLPSPSPSPSKRAHSSASPPALGTHDPEQSPRVSRTKLSNDSLATARECSDAQRFRAGEGPAMPDTLTASASAGTSLVGLGVELAENGTGSLAPAPAPAPADSAHEQTRKLMAVGPEMAAILSRMSSQHHGSEYNVLKRVVAASVHPPAVHPPSSSPPPLPLPPLPQPILLVRTRSQPTRARAPLQLSTTARLSPSLSPRVDPNKIYANLMRQRQSDERNSPVGARSVPTVSRAATPPPRQTPATPVANPADVFLSSTSLTPTLGNFTFSPPSRSPVLPGASNLGANGTGADLDVVGALDEALRSTLDRSPVLPCPSPGPAPNMVRTTLVPNSIPIAVPLLPGMQIINGFACKTSTSHPMNISPLLPPEFLPVLASHVFGSTSAKPRSPLTPSFSLSSNSLPPTPTRPFMLDTPPSCDLWNLTAPNALRLPAPDATGWARPFGNFLLSSCPGKKVRLGTPPGKGGRSGICRDLKMDLQRAKDEGVRLVICCLDDQELGYLGAPWDEYERTAASLSLAVIRIPMVEGFAPASPAMLDEHLTRVVRFHSLRGEAVLAHCRGGIGRAGLVACCWMIKCGLLGLDLSLEGAEARAEAMRIVERVIDVVRRRRSVKAIETPQQVHFLLDYISFLQAQAHAVRASDL